MCDNHSDLDVPHRGCCWSLPQDSEMSVISAWAGLRAESHNIMPLEKKLIKHLKPLVKELHSLGWRLSCKVRDETSGPFPSAQLCARLEMWDFTRKWGSYGSDQNWVLEIYVYCSVTRKVPAVGLTCVSWTFVEQFLSTIWMLGPADSLDEAALLWSLWRV